MDVRDRLRRLPAVLVGLYAWAFTVLPPALDPKASAIGGLAAGIALLGLVLAGVVRRGLPTLVFGIDLFVLASAVSWWGAHTSAIALAPGPFGVLGWVAFPLAWGALSSPTAEEGSSEPGPRLEPRTASSRLPLAVLGVALLVSLGIVLLRPPLERPASAVLFAMVALGVALQSLRTGESLASRLQLDTDRLPSAAVLVRAIGGPLLLALLLLLGLFGLELGRSKGAEGPESGMRSPREFSQPPK